MRITYSGTVREVTVSAQAALAALAAGRDPSSRMIQRGTVEVRPTDVEGRVSAGRFRVSVDDNPDVLHGYRFCVTGELVDPCAEARARARQARQELDLAKRDGASDNVIRHPEQALAERRQELLNCARDAGVPGVNFGSPLLISRSMDLFRTAVRDTSIGNLRLFVRILTPDDVEFLNSLPGVNIRTFIATSEIADEIRQNLPDGVTLKSLGTHNGHINITFSAERFNLTFNGKMKITVALSRSYDFRKIVSLRLAELDMDGLLDGDLGELAERLSKQIRESAERAVANSETRFNTNLAGGLRKAFDSGFTATLLGVRSELAGLRVSVALGFVRGPRRLLDSCQRIRDAMRRLRDEIFVAVRDGLPQDRIDRLEGELEVRRRALQRCRLASGSDQPPPPPDFPTDPS